MTRVGQYLEADLEDAREWYDPDLLDVKGLPRMTMSCYCTVTGSKGAMICIVQASRKNLRSRAVSEVVVRLDDVQHAELQFEVLNLGLRLMIKTLCGSSLSECDGRHEVARRSMRDLPLI